VSPKKKKTMLHETMQRMVSSGYQRSWPPMHDWSAANKCRASNPNRCWMSDVPTEFLFRYLDYHSDVFHASKPRPSLKQQAKPEASEVTAVDLNGVMALCGQHVRRGPLRAVLAASAQHPVLFVEETQAGPVSPVGLRLVTSENLTSFLQPRFGGGAMGLGYTPLPLMLCDGCTYPTRWAIRWGLHYQEHSRRLSLPITDPPAFAGVRATVRAFVRSCSRRNFFERIGLRGAVSSIGSDAVAGLAGADV